MNTLARGNAILNSQHRWDAYFALVVLLISCARIAYLGVSELDLMFDEAQYWLWSTRPDFGYYSKPPLLAWVIALSTLACGDGEACVRLPTPLAHAVAALGIYLTAQTLFASRRGLEKAKQIGFAAGVLYLTAPGVSFSNTFISTDPLLLACWSFAIWLVSGGRQATDARVSVWLWAGVAVGLGILAKYAMFLFFPCLVLAIWQGLTRWQLTVVRTMLLGVPAFLLFLPNLLWNLQNELVTFQHTQDNADFNRELFNPGQLLEFMAWQFGVFGPLAFPILIAVFAGVRRAWQEPSERLLVAFSLPYLAFFTAVSFISRSHPNWSAPVYVGGSLLVAAWLLNDTAPCRRRWLVPTIAANVLIGLVLFNYPAVLSLAGVPLNRHIDLFRHQTGQEELGAAVSGHLQADPSLVLMSDNRKVLAPLFYYVHPRPSAAVKWDDNGRIDDYYEMHNPPSLLRDQRFLLVTQRAAIPDIARRFETAEALPPISLHIYPDQPTVYYVFRLSGFRTAAKDRRGS